jgi:Skp family chaperone for outer membrane proteins
MYKINSQFVMIKFFKGLSLILVFGCCFLFHSVSAQTAVKNNAGILFINGYVFEDSVKGIKKIVRNIKLLENELKPMVKELEKLRSDYSSLESRIKTTGNTDQKLLEDAEKIRRDLTYKNEDLKTIYNKRYSQIMNPIYNEISVVMNTWCKQKGYTALMDYSKITNGMLLWIDEEAVDANTTELISYINSKVL